MTSGLGNAAFVAVLAIVPLVVLMLTSFVKISVVLSLLRNAIGAPDAPSGLVVMGLSLILTFFVMAPVAIDMVHAAVDGPSTTPVPGPTVPAPGPSRSSPATAVPTSAPGAIVPTPVPATSSPGAASSSPGATVPTSVPATSSPGAARSSPTPDGEASAPAVETRPLDLDGTIRGLVPAQYRLQVDAAVRALVPLRGFLARHASPRDRETFTALATRMGRTVGGDELWILAPAFVTTELREAFAIAVLIFVPFLVLDLLVGLGLAALGLSSTPPGAIALPLKLLLFVSVDGWRLLIDSLLRGYV
jgi:type III secretion protein R